MLEKSCREPSEVLSHGVTRGCAGSMRQAHFRSEPTCVDPVDEIEILELKNNSFTHPHRAVLK